MDSRWYCLRDVVGGILRLPWVRFSHPISDCMDGGNAVHAPTLKTESIPQARCCRICRASTSGWCARARRCTSGRSRPRCRRASHSVWSSRSAQRRIRSDPAPRGVGGRQGEGGSRRTHLPSPAGADRPRPHRLPTIVWSETEFSLPINIKISGTNGLSIWMRPGLKRWQQAAEARDLPPLVDRRTALPTTLRIRPCLPQAATSLRRGTPAGSPSHGHGA